MSNFTDMLSKAKKMQEKMKEVQDIIKKIEVQGKAGGDLVTVTLTGDYDLKSIEISDDWKKNNLIEIEQRLTGWQLKSFQESYKHKKENGISLFTKNLINE